MGWRKLFVVIYAPDARRIPDPVDLDPTGTALTWDPYVDGGLAEVAPLPDDDLLDRVAALARPMPVPTLAAAVLRIARSDGPLSWCSTCANLHRDAAGIRWRMARPGPLRRGRSISSEPLSDWVATAAHINALRRVIAKLRDGRPGDPADWQELRPPTVGLRRDLVDGSGDPLDVEWERREPDLGDVARERSAIAGHLSRWLFACEVGPAVRWDGDDAEPGRSSGSLLGELGVRLVDELVAGAFVVTCSGTVRGQACRVTWRLRREVAAAGLRLCRRCDDTRRTAKHRGQWSPDQRAKEAARVAAYRAAKNSRQHKEERP
jgi:hypothetical protein